MAISQSSLRVTFFVTIIALALTGLVFIYSASSVYAMELYQDSAFFVKKQLVALILAAIITCILALLPLETLQKVAPIFFLISLGLTCATLIPGIGSVINGSRRWLFLAGFSLQPSELLKSSFILYFASYLDRKPINSARPSKTFLPILIILGICCIILLKQPDFGQAVTLTLSVLLIFFITGGNSKYLLWLSFIFIIGTGILGIAKPYRFRRILIFLDPWKDPQGAGFQIIQSLIAIGSGSWLGTGIAQSKQKFFYLPMQHTDFIFSVIAEETGFIGVSLLISLFLLLLWSGIRLAKHMTTTFGAIACLGFTFLVLLQTVMNICVSTGLVPTKGIGLPFISYGGSSLLGLSILLGSVLNASLEESFSH